MEMELYASCQNEGTMSKSKAPGWNNRAQLTIPNCSDGLSQALPPCSHDKLCVRSAGLERGGL